MYSRYQNRSDGRVQLPKDYGGCAFSSESASPAPSGTGRIEIARPTAAEPELHTEPSLPLPPVEVTHREVASSPKTAHPPLLPTGLFPMGKGFPIARGIGFEELLLLGLILLLSQSDAGSETVLWLCLLLFCG